jgi:three-Cys-motif partner protein
MLRCLNVEANRKRFLSLEAATEPFKPEIVEANYHSTFVEALPDILERIGTFPAFFFIDPFGTKGIAFKDLLPVFTRPSRTEVLITLQTDGIAKKAGYFKHLDSPHPKMRELARDLTAHLAAVLDIPLPTLRKGWAESVDTTEFAKRVLHYYLTKLAKRMKFTKAFRVVYYRDNALTQSVCFYLVFATQSPKGLFVMNDCMVNAVRAFNRDVYSDSFFPIFEEEYERRVGRTAARQEVVAHFEKRSFTIDDVKRHCMQRTDYLLKGSEYRALILEMAKPGGGLTKLDPGPSSNAQTRFKVTSGSGGSAAS